MVRTIGLAVLLSWAGMTFAGGHGAAQAPKPPAAPETMRIMLDRKTPDGKIQTMASDHVFEPGDLVQIRMKSDFDGYLYVMDQGTSGKYSTVFPSADTGSDNRVRQGQEISIPLQSGTWFEISGPPGFDVLYFVLSPSALSAPPSTSFTAPVPLSSLKPRCNDAIFRARGECTDPNAGPAPLPKDAPLPAPLEPMAGMASRDINVVKNKTQVTVGASGNKTAPLIYTFRIAHH